MTSKKVVGYIRGLLQKGYDISAIKNTMLKYGYSSKDIDEAVSEIYNPTIRHEIHLGKTTIFAIVFIVISVAGISFFLYYNPPKGPAKLLDLNLEPVKTDIEAGQSISFVQVLSNQGSSKRFDVSVMQEILDPKTFKVITHKSETRAIETFTSTPTSVLIPPETPAGDYILRVIVDYDNKKAVATLPIKVVSAAKKETCFDNIQNQDEEGVDCGGSCIACKEETIDCNDDDPCTSDLIEDEKCINNPISPCCGNQVCESIETFESCSSDCREIPQEVPTSTLDDIKQIAKANPEKALQECGKIEIPDIKDICISNIGEAQQNKEYCTKIQNSRIKDLCYSNIAKTANDNSLCSEISSDPRRDSCYMTFMLDNDDYSVCDKITDKTFKYQCESLKQLHEISQQSS